MLLFLVARSLMLLWLELAILTGLATVVDVGCLKLLMLSVDLSGLGFDDERGVDDTSARLVVIPLVSISGLMNN